MHTHINRLKSADTFVERRKHERRKEDSPGYVRMTMVGWYDRRERNRRKENNINPTHDRNNL